MGYGIWDGYLTFTANIKIHPPPKGQKEMEAAKTALEATSDSDLRVPCYCEENVWRLAYRMLHGGGGQKEEKQQQPEVVEKDLQYHVVFVSNPQKCCLFLHQIINDNPLEPCLWDYHVILFCTNLRNNLTVVQDIDSHLPYKIILKEYLLHVFPELTNEGKQFSPYFRVIDAATFLDTFASSRMHMYNTKTNKWNSPPPPYPCIQKSEGENNINRYMTILEKETYQENKATMEQSGFGAVYTLSQLKERFHV